MKEAATTVIEKKKDVFIYISVKKDKNTLTWNYDREFIYKGQMYNVVFSKVGGSITFLCYHDTHETWITKEIENCINHLFGKSDHKKKENFYGKYAAKKFIHYLFRWRGVKFFQIGEKNIFNYPSNYQFLILNNPFVPPEFRIDM